MAEANGNDANSNMWPVLILCFHNVLYAEEEKKRQILLGKDKNKTGKNRGTTNCSDLNRGILTVGLVRLG
jgi:hypothetical protein